MNQIDLGTVKIPVAEFAGQGNAILGIRDSGKSYTATYCAERLLDAGIPFVAFDPIGVWRYLKVPGKGKGYKIVVAGENADLPLTPDSAAEIVRSAMRENIPLVLDLYSMKLSKADWKKIVETSLRLLLYENKQCGLRHVFIEEAAEFCPQRVGPDQGRVYAEIEKLARMGGNASLGYTLINQRGEEVNKAVLELCDCLFLHRQKGRNSLTALGKWLDFADATKSKEVIKSLPMLPQGKLWVWSQGSDEPREATVPEKNSLHPDRRHPEKAKGAVALDVTAFVEKMKGSLDRHIAIAKENDPALLKKRINELERQLKSQTPTIQFKEVSILTVDDRQLINEAVRLCEDARNACGLELDNVCRIGVELMRIKEKIPAPLQQPRQVMGSTSFPEVDRATAVRRRVPESSNGDSSLGRCERAILTALAQYPDGRTTTQVAILTGYSVGSGGFNNSLSKLRSAGFITRGQVVQISDSGLTALGAFEPLPTGKELALHWLNRLAKCESAILGALIEVHPHGLTSEAVAERTGYHASSGGFNNSLSRLRTLELITRGQPMKASEDFFQ